MTAEELKALQDGFRAQLQELVNKHNGEVATMGTALNETKEQLTSVRKQLDALDERLQAGQFTPGGGKDKPLADFLKEQDSLARLMKDRRGTATIQIKADMMHHFKTTLTSGNVGATPRQTTGVLPIERTQGIVEEARRPLVIRGLLASRPTSFQVVDYVKVSTPMTEGSPQEGEGIEKKEQAVVFTSASERVKTIASWIPASRQIMDDWGELESYLRGGLSYWTSRTTETQLLTGDATGENLNGLITQATAFNTALLGSSYTRIDIIGRALEQVDIANEIDPGFVVVNSRDWWELRLTKDSYGRYILGDPQLAVTPTIFGKTLVKSNAMTAGTFLVGSGSPVASEIRDRMEMTIEISTEHSDFFTTNKVAIRAEERLALVVYRAGSYIYGSLTPSPA